jgi:hypothetical protein
MNPGPVEEAGKVAGGIVSALGSQPAVLALVVANLGMLAFLFYALSAAATFRNEMLKHQYEYQREISDLLSRCVVPRSDVPDIDRG